MVDWKRVDGFTGVMYREHPTRRHGPRADRLFGYRMQVDGKRRFEIIGWASAGWTPKKAMIEMERLREAAKTGSGPASRAEKKAIAEAERLAQKETEAQRKREETTVFEYFAQVYFPAQEGERDISQKSARAVKREEELFRLWVAPVIGDVPIKLVTPFALERVKKVMLEAGRAPRTVEYALSTIRQIINHARKGAVFIGDNPVSAVKKPKTDNRRDRFLTQDEADRLLDTLAAKSVQVRDMALLSLHCGLRAGEIFALTWGNVDLVSGVLSIRDTKSRKNRTAFMTQAVKDMLESRARQNPADLIFPSENGGIIAQISQSFVKAVNELGLNTGRTDRRERVVFHTLRHTFASWLVQRGVDLYTVSKLMGHESQAMTQRYAHLAPDHLQAAVKVFEAGMAHKEEPEKKVSDASLTI